jgi:hypothetical protein
VVADSATDTLTLVAGSNITITTNAGTDTITIAAAGGGTLTAGAIYYGFNSNTGSYTLVLGDAGKVVVMNSSSANTVTVPLNSSVTFPTGSVVNVVQTGSGQTSITGSAGVTIQSEGSKYKVKAQYGLAGVVKTDTNTWVGFGNLVS